LCEHFDLEFLTICLGNPDGELSSYICLEFSDGMASCILSSFHSPLVVGSKKNTRLKSFEELLVKFKFGVSKILV